LIDDAVALGELDQAFELVRRRIGVEIVADDPVFRHRLLRMATLPRARGDQDHQIRNRQPALHAGIIASEPAGTGRLDGPLPVRVD
jgi:hypothetical protein